MKSWQKWTLGIVILAIIILVYDATYGFKALLPGASGASKPAGAWYPWNRSPKPAGYYASNADGSPDYGHRADGTPIPLG